MYLIIVHKHVIKQVHEQNYPRNLHEGIFSQD
jgi:hypothetical protein